MACWNHICICHHLLQFICEQNANLSLNSCSRTDTIFQYDSLCMYVTFKTFDILDVLPQIKVIIGAIWDT